MTVIPEKHKKYNLLPGCRKCGCEAFSYDCEIQHEIDDLMDETDTVIPYSYASFDELFQYLDELEQKYRSNPKTVSLLQKYRKDLIARNRKEDWSVCKYLGESFGVLGLTKGRYYYWPCSKSNPEYEGVIDDEEFTSYLYPVDESLWEIAEDPTGMARKIMEKEKHHKGSWFE